jgi:hypothetical protein
MLRGHLDADKVKRKHISVWKREICAGFIDSAAIDP